MRTKNSRQRNKFVAGKIVENVIVNNGNFAVFVINILQINKQELLHVEIVYKEHLKY